MRATIDPCVGRRRIACAALAALLCLAPPVFAADDEQSESNLQGSVEVIYRHVSQDGSAEKYDEDFDGLATGGRLANLSLDWTNQDSKLVDFASVDLSGLGGDPYERSAFKFGRKDSYDLRVTHTRQTYLYNLFELVSNEDGAIWDTERTMTNIDFRLHATDDIRVHVGFQKGERTGMSLFMKDLSRDLFRFETPLDQQVSRYTVGADFNAGPVDIVFRQALHRYDNQFDNFTEGDLGLDLGNQTRLDHYDWRQNDHGTANMTTLKLHADVSDRVAVTASFHGTLLGDEELESHVDVEQLGLSFSGSEFGGECAASPGVSCSTDATCDALVAGDVCVPLVGTSRLELQGDSTLVDVDVSVRIIDPVQFHVQYRSLERDLEGTLMRDLDGDGFEDDIDGDGLDGTRTRSDYELDTLTGFIEARPGKKVGLRVGYRMIDRKLDREGFGTTRDVDFKSDDDETAIFGLSLRPVKWFRLNADFEDGDVGQPFNAVAPRESERTRVRVALLPVENLRIDLGYLDFEHTNTAPDIRDPGSNFGGASDGSTHSIAVWHKPNDRVDYLLRYAEQEIMTDVRVTFDQAGFFATETGNSIFDNDNEQISGVVNVKLASGWKGYARYMMTESVGDNLLLGDVSGLVNNERISQEYHDAEVGLTYTFDSGLFVGASLRDFDYDDGNNLLDYDGQMFTFRAGVDF